MAFKETGKTRSSRIPLDYYKQPLIWHDWRSWTELHWKLGLAGLGLLLALAYFSYAAFSPSRPMHTAFSHGPLSSAHAQLSCHDCHTDFVPISRQAALFDTAAMQAGNIKCNACHFDSEQHNELGNNTHHFQLMRSNQDQSCLNCHTEHAGEIDHRSVANQRCFDCHGHAAERFTPQAQTRTFTAMNEHPPMRSLGSTDPGKLRFNHAVHLGLDLTRVAVSVPSKLGVDPGRKSLRCEDCHVMSAASEDAGRTSTPGAVDYHPQPIVYETHCQACHPLDVASGDARGQITHGTNQQQVLAEIRSFFADHPPPDTPRLGSQTRFARPGQPSSAVARPTSDDIAQWFLDSTVHAFYPASLDEDAPRDNCYLCHAPDQGNAFKVSLMRRPSGESSDHLDQGRMVRHRRLSHARFDHNQHPASLISCQECHDGTEKNQVITPSPLMMPDIAKCKECHSTAPTHPFQHKFGSADIGVPSANCTQCHRFHSDLTIANKSAVRDNTAGRTGEERKR